MRQLLWIIVSLAAAARVQASESTVLFDSSMSPTGQGWTFASAINGSSQLGAPLIESIGADGYSMSTVGLPGNSPTKGALHFWGKDLGIPPGSAFAIDFKLQVHSGSYNRFDAGIGFSLAMTSAAPIFFFDPNMRNTMIFFADDRIGFGDFSSMFAVAATEMNRYRLYVTADDELRVYVNEELALTRSGFTSTGFIGFGDSTNDPGVDGAFTIGSITYTPIPEPSAVVICLSLIFGLFPIRQAKSSRHSA